MKVSDALKARKSTRAFLDKPVEKAKLLRILESARHAPSGVNTQPWQVAIVSGNSKQQLENQIETMFREGEKPNMDYQYYPLTWESPFSERRKACGKLLYSTLEISREDKQRQKDQWAANYRAFDAPVMMFFFLDAKMQAGSFIDYGMFLQSVMLAAQELGLATCPQASLAEYPDIVKKTLGYPAESVLLCGMAIGYEDSSASVNSYRTSREEVSTFARFFE